MSSNDSFGQREDGQHKEQEPGKVGGAVDQFEDGPQTSIQDANWNGFSPQTEVKHYSKRIREQAGEERHEVEEGREDINVDISTAPIKRKRLESAPLVDQHPPKRLQGDISDRRHVNQVAQQYGQPESCTPTDFQLNSPYEPNMRNVKGLGQAFQESDSRGRSRWRTSGKVHLPGMPHQQPRTESGDRYDVPPVNSRNGSNMRRGQSDMPEWLRDTPYRQRAMSVAPSNRQPYRDLSNYYDLTTPENAHGRKKLNQFPGSSGGRRNTALNEENFDSSPRPYGGHPHFEFRAPYENRLDPFGTSHSYSRAQSVAPGIRTGNTNRAQYFSPNASNFGGRNFSVEAAREHVTRESSLAHNYSDLGRPQVGQFKREAAYELMTPSSERKRHIYAERPQNFESRPDKPQMGFQTDDELDEDDDSENDLEGCFRPRMRPSAHKMKGAPKSPSQSVLSQPLNFAGSRRGSGLDYSQGETNPTTLYQGQSRTSSNALNLSMPYANGGKGLYGVIQTSFTQRAEILAREKAEQHRQKVAEQKIEQRKKRAEVLKDHDNLFEEPPIDESWEDRIRESNRRAKKKKELNEDESLIRDTDKKLREELEVRHKKRQAEEREEQREEKKKRLAADRQRIAKEEEVRLEAKRKAAKELLERTRRQEANESARAERLAFMELNKEAAKKRAAAMQSARKSDKAVASRNAIQSNEVSELRDCEFSSDGGGMFISDDEASVNDLSKQELRPDKEAVEKSASPQKPAPVTDNGDGTHSSTVSATQEPETIAENEHIISSADISVDQPKVIADNEQILLAADTSGVQKSNLVAEALGGQPPTVSTAQELQVVTEHEEYKSPVIPVFQRPENNPVAGPSHVTGATVQQAQTLASNKTSISIADLVSDGRRRPPEVPRPKFAGHNQPDPIRFTSVANSQRARTPAKADSSSTSNTRNTSRSTQNVDHAPGGTASVSRKVSQDARNAEKADRETQGKLRRFIEQETVKLQAEAKAQREEEHKKWDIMMDQLSAVLKAQEAALKAHKQATSDRKNTSDPRLSHPVAKNGHPLNAFAPQSKRLSLISRINLATQVETQEKEKEEAERAKLEKYEKNKAEARKRYEREIRKVLAGQGLEQDDEKILKQVQEKMAAWEANRRKKERRESGGSVVRLSQPSETSASDIEEAASPPTLEASDAQEKDPLSEKTKQREQTIRAGLQSLASQNKASSDFAKAASKLRIQQLDSDSEESEEDPDSESEEESAPFAKAKAGNEVVEDMEGLDTDDTLRSDVFDAEIMPPLPEPPSKARGMLPDLVNPPEEDMMHSYVVRHRAERGNNVYDSVVLGSFHNVDEANAFARQKLDEIVLSPLTGKSESHDKDNLYVGRATTDKFQRHAESIWVTREIIYIGDVANLKRGDLKNIVQSKVYNVLQVIKAKDGKAVGSVVTTTSIKALANKKAADHFLALSKPSRPRMDWMNYFNDVVTPMVREKLKLADDNDETVDFGEGQIPDGEKRFTVTVSENPVVGPLN